jgi:hypothetical protein
MHVKTVNISLSERVFSNTKNIGGIHLPDFNAPYVFTKQSGGLSDDEIKKKVVMQAHIDYANGEINTTGFIQLEKFYACKVSPNRNGIITEGLQAIAKNRQRDALPLDIVATLLEGEARYQRLPTGETDYIDFYDKNGELVATYSNNGWTMITTKAEAARQAEICQIYGKAWNDAKNGKLLVNCALTDIEKAEVTFDVKA